MKQLRLFTTRLLCLFVVTLLNSCTTFFLQEPHPRHLPPVPLIDSDTAKVIEYKTVIISHQVNLAWALDTKYSALVSANYNTYRGSSYGLDAALGRWWSNKGGRAEIYAGISTSLSNLEMGPVTEKYKVAGIFAQGCMALSSRVGKRLLFQTGIVARANYDVLLDYSDIYQNKTPSKTATYSTVVWFIKLQGTHFGLQLEPGGTFSEGNSPLFHETSAYSMTLGCTIRF
ncbi:MAG: hypothetical protein U0Y96_00705 [Candidatus Kapaibacterium sp.]